MSFPSLSWQILKHQVLIQGLLFRLLVIIVSLGFGIVKPRLGPTLHRVVGIGGLYFVIASTEAWLRIVKPKNDLSSVTLFAEIPLAVIDRFESFPQRCWTTLYFFRDLKNETDIAGSKVRESSASMPLS